jgi:hypothetical protein
MDRNVTLPLASSLLSFVFTAFLLDQWRERRRPYQLIWAVGMLWYALSARFGQTRAFFVGEFLGVLLLFAGFLISIEVFREIRVPFTGIVVARRAERAAGS